MYEIFTPPIKKKKDLFTLKKMSVKVQKRMNCAKNFYKFLCFSEHCDNKF